MKPATPSLLAVTQYGSEGASARVRIHEWLSHLKLEADVFDYAGLANSSPSTMLRHPAAVAMAEVRLRRMIPNVSDRHVILSKQASPFSRGDIEESLLREAGRGVYDFDDAIFNASSSGVRAIGSKASSWHAALTSADKVIAGNTYLASHAMQFADSSTISVIPSCIEPTSYTAKTNYDLSESPEAVWLGSPGTEKYLQIAAKPLLELHRRYGLRLVLISSGHRSLGDLDAMTRRVQWRLGQPQQILKDFDLGLMPLPDDPWTRGKCAFKLLEYAAAGLPVVASPVGANREALSALGGISAGDPGSWFDGIAALLDSPTETRRSLGMSAISGVRANYSFSAWSEEWLSVVVE